MVRELRKSSGVWESQRNLKSCLVHPSKIYFVWFDSLRPINNLSIIKGRVFLGWTSTKLGLMCLLKDTTQWRRWGSKPAAPRSPVKHPIIKPLRSLGFTVVTNVDVNNFAVVQLQKFKYIVLSMALGYSRTSNKEYQTIYHMFNSFT